MTDSPSKPLSQLILDGAKCSLPNRGSLFDQRPGEVRCCAIGAAYLALNDCVVPDRISPLIEKAGIYRPTPGALVDRLLVIDEHRKRWGKPTAFDVTTLNGAVFFMNDVLCMTREGIAAVLAKHGL